MEYIAGLFDGEGSVGIVKMNKKDMINPYYQLRITIYNSNNKTLEKINRLIGFGSVKKIKKRDGQNQQPFSYSCYSNNAVKFLMGIHNFLFIKKEQSKLGIDFQILFNTELGLHKGRECPLSDETVSIRDAYYWKMRELNSSRNS